MVAIILGGGHLYLNAQQQRTQRELDELKAELKARDAAAAKAKNDHEAAVKKARGEAQALREALCDWEPSCGNYLAPGAKGAWTRLREIIQFNEEYTSGPPDAKVLWQQAHEKVRKQRAN